MPLILTGSLAVDQIMSFSDQFAKLIKADELKSLSISVLVDQLNRSRGGIAGNIAHSLALLGEKPILLGSIGDDQREYMADLAKMGVDTDFVHFSKLPTATFTVLTDQNNCQVGGFYPGAMSDAAELSFKKFGNNIENLFVLSSHDPAQMAVQINESIEHNLRLVFDIGQQVIALLPEVLIAGITQAELIILNEYEINMLVSRTNLTMEELIKLARICIVTLGANGTKIMTANGQITTIPAIPNCQVLDPTGAGDAYRAGFLYGYVRKWSLERSIKLGSTVAAFAIEHMGTQQHTFTISQLQKRFQAGYKEELKL